MSESAHSTAGSEAAANLPSGEVFVRIAVSVLKPLAVKLLQRKGMFAAEAEIVANCLIDADRCGRFASGMATLPEILDTMDLGDIDPRARFIKAPSAKEEVAVFDGSTGMGCVAVTRARTQALEMARTAGAGIVAVKNSRRAGDSEGLVSRIDSPGSDMVLVVASRFAILNDASRGDSEDDARTAIAVWLGNAPDSRVVILPTSELSDWPGLGDLVATGWSALDEPRAGKRKSNPAANTLEHLVVAASFEQMPSFSEFLARFGPASRSAHMAMLDSSDQIASEEVPIPLAAASALKELGSKIKYDVPW